MDFHLGREYLLFDQVDEGKLLLFVKTQVVERVSCKGRHLVVERKWRLNTKVEESRKKRRKTQEARAIVEEVLEELVALDSSDKEPKSKLLLMYNLVQSYVFAIIELWSHQVSKKLHLLLLLHNIAIKALKTFVACGQHARCYTKFEDYGLATIKDKYTTKQILDITRATWRNALGV